MNVKKYVIEINFHCCNAGLLTPRTDEIIKIMGRDPNSTEIMEHECDMVFNYDNEVDYRETIEKLHTSVDDIEYFVSVSCGWNASDNTDTVVERYIDEQFDNDDNIDDLFHLSGMITEILVRMTNVHNAAYIMAFASGAATADFDLEEDVIRDAFETGMEVARDSNNDNVNSVTN